MNTFLPYPDFKKSAQCLDNKRLGKQRVEVLQMLNAIHGLSKGWRNHPVIKMWADYPNALVDYGLAICDEWKQRGFKDTCYEKILKFKKGKTVLPNWLGDKRLHLAYQSNLVRKDYKFYSHFRVFAGIPYIWK